jgi:hypothetical protein
VELLISSGSVTRRKKPRGKPGSINQAEAKKRIVAAYSALGLDVPITKTGQKKHRESPLSPEERLQYVSIDADACEGSGDESLATLADRTTAKRILETSIPDLLRGASGLPLQPRYRSLRESGRTSCTKGFKKGHYKEGDLAGFQIQNPDRKGGIRECFVTYSPEEFQRLRRLIGIADRIAPEDVHFIDNDFSGLELCTMAQACVTLVGYSKLGEAINAGLDAHLALGASMLGISYDQASAEKYTKRVKNARQLAKIANFGFPGGLSAAAFVSFAAGYGVKITLSEAEDLKRAWLAKWDEFVLYFRLMRDLVNAGDGFATIEQLFTGRVRGRCSFTVLCNTWFQGLGADGALLALWEVTRACYVPSASVLYGNVFPWAFVHDQIISHVASEVAHEAALEKAKIMNVACNLYLPDVPVSSIPALSKRWCKDAEAIFHPSTGRLIPFDVAREQKSPAIYQDGRPVEWLAA